jgi:hypothetical protein
LWCYLVAVAAAVGVDACSGAVRLGGDGFTGCLRLRWRWPRLPELGLLLCWDPDAGWSVRAETEQGDRIALAYLGSEPLPDPERVTAFLGEYLAGHYPGDPRPAHFGLSPTALAPRLARYTHPTPR